MSKKPHNPPPKKQQPTTTTKKNKKKKIKNNLGLSRYQDAIPVPTSPLADDLATAPSGAGVAVYSVSLKYEASVLRNPYFRRRM